MSNPTVEELVGQWRLRQAWHKQEKALTTRSKSMCRLLVGGDKKEALVLYKSVMNERHHPLAEAAYEAILPFVKARDEVIKKSRMKVEQRLAMLTEKLPVFEWVKSMRGVGMLSLAGIVAEAGDLNNYATVSKLWKRMGVAVINGERQQRKQGAAALDHGYDPERRTVVWHVGNAIVQYGDSLKVFYVRRKLHTEKTHPEWTKMHRHNDAKRYATKEFLKLLWREWRRA